MEIGGSDGLLLNFLWATKLLLLWRLEVRKDLIALCVHCIYMSNFFRDHTHRLVRVDPLRNLPPGSLTPSPTRRNPIDLPDFPLVVDLGPIPMENLNNLPRHLPGNGNNGNNRGNRNNEHERASNVGEADAQLRTMREYMNPLRQTPTSAIVIPAHQATLNLKPGMLQALS